MNFKNNFNELSNPHESAENTTGRGLFNTVLGTGLFIAGVGVTELKAEDKPEKPDAVERELERAKAELGLQQKADADLSELLKRIDSAHLPFDAEASLERALLSVEQRGHQASMKRAEEKVRILEEKMEKVNKKMDLQNRLQKISYMLRAKDCASRPGAWTEFTRGATNAFARYEKVQTLTIEDPIRLALIEDMNAAVKEYQTPNGPTDEKAIASSMHALSKLETALNIFDTSFIAFVQLPAGSAMQFVNEKGEKSPVFDIEADKYDEYPFGVATMTKSEKQTSKVAGVVTWKLTLDPAFKGAVKIRKNGEWISKQVPPVLEAPAAQPRVEEKKTEEPSEQETAVEDEMIIDPSLLMEVDAPYYENAVSKTGVRHLLKRYVAARTRYLNTVEADEDQYGACAKYQAFVQAFDQEICEISAYSGLGHADDFDRHDWSNLRVGADECDEAIERMLQMLDRYEREKGTFAKGAMKKVDGIAYWPANEAETLKDIERYTKMMTARFGAVPEKYATLHKAYEEVLERAKKDKEPSKRIISITLNHWRDAARKAAFAEKPKKKEAVSSISSFFGGAVKQATAVTGFSKDMDPIELRTKLIELSATQEFEFVLSADALEALIRIKSVVPELVGKDGSFLHGISAEGKSGEIAGTHAPKLEAATAKGQGAIKIIEGMTNYDIVIMSKGAFDKDTIDWILAAINSPVPFKGIPQGMFICIVRKDVRGF